MSNANLNGSLLETASAPACAETLQLAYRLADEKIASGGSDDDALEIENMAIDGLCGLGYRLEEVLTAMDWVVAVSLGIERQADRVTAYD